MATNYPTSLDSFTNPVSTDTLATAAGSTAVPHANQHANLNDAVLAIQTKLGAGSTTLGSGIVNSSLIKIGALSAGTVGFVKVDASGNLTSDSSTYLTTGTAASTYAPLTSPSLTTPSLGVATATSINKVTITAPTTSATLTLITGSTLATNTAASLTLGLSSAAATVATIPSGTVTLMDLGTAQSITSIKTFSTAPVISTINAGGTTATASLFPDVTISTGTIAIGAGLTTGTINIANAITTGGVNIASTGTGITPIVIGHTNATIGLTGNTTVTGTLTSTSTIDASSGVTSFFGTPTSMTIGNAATTATLFPASTTLSLGNTATGAQTVNMFSGSTTTGSSYTMFAGATAGNKTIAIGTGGASGSNTNITLGSGTSGATGTTRINGSIAFTNPVTNATSTYTVGINDTFLIFSAAQTVTLPTASTYPGRMLVLKLTASVSVVSASANVVPLITGAAATTIFSAATAGKFTQLVSDGTNWIVMMQN